MKKNNKFKKFIYLVLLFFFILSFQTIVYSAINGTMSVSGDAVARAEADVRITDFRLSTTNNATSSYEEFGKTHIVTEVDLLDTTSSITYYVEITNYGSVDIGIFDITGLPSGVNYSIKDYNLHDKICDENNKCNSFIKKTLELTLTTTGTYAGNIQLDFDFRTYHKVTYTGITNNNYQAEVIDGGNFKVTFKEELKRVQVMYNNREILYYKKVLNGQTITLSNITDDIEVKIKEQVAKLVSGDLNEVGSEVCIKDECFYIMNNDGTTITMLAKYNLLIGNKWTGPELIALENPTGIQDSTAIGWFAERSESNPVIGAIGFYSGTESYWSTTVSSFPTYVYNSNSTIYSYLETYKQTLINYGVDISNIRLIDVNELVELGCSTSSNSCTSSSYSWLYSTTYWTGSASDSTMLWNVISDGSLQSQLTFRDFGEGDVINTDTIMAMQHGARPVIELDVAEVAPLVRVESGDLDTVGSEICIKDECFNVISSDTDSVTMLAKYNLYVGGVYDGTTWTAYGTEVTGIQNSKMIGYHSGQTINNGTTIFSTTNYWESTTSSYPAYVYNENATIYTYVENYKTYLSTLGITSKEARVITYEELETLGCNGDDRSCKGAPSWVYSTSYWTGSAAVGWKMWYLYSDGKLTFNYNTEDRYFGVRPVITIPKWLFANTIEFTIGGTTYYAKEGMTWREWSQSKYNILNLYESGNVLRNSSLTYLGYMIDNKCYTHDLDSAIDNTKNYTLSCGSGSDD